MEAHFNLVYEIVCQSCESGDLTEIGRGKKYADGGTSRLFKCEKCGKITNTYLQVCELMYFSAAKKRLIKEKSND